MSNPAAFRSNRMPPVPGQRNARHTVSNSGSLVQRAAVGDDVENFLVCEYANVSGHRVLASLERTKQRHVRLHHPLASREMRRTRHDADAVWSVAGGTMFRIDLRTLDDV